MEVKHIFSVLLCLALSEFSVAQTKAKQKCASYDMKRSDSFFNVYYVYGGKSTRDDEFPNMVALGYGNISSPNFLCGGTLISEQYVLTAAHCAAFNGSPVKMVRLGTRYVTSEIGFTDGIVTNIIKHPQYKPPSRYNDIALLKLKVKLRFDSSIRPACLHTTKDLTTSQKSLTALGWGNIDFAGPPADNLQKVTLNHVSGSQCSTSYKNNKQELPSGVRDDLQICAGGIKGKDTCQGDSGGPLEYLLDKTHYIVGVTSFGKACGISGAPGVYTRVSAYVPWIESIVW